MVSGIRSTAHGRSISRQRRKEERVNVVAYDSQAGKEMSYSKTEIIAPSL